VNFDVFLRINYSLSFHTLRSQVEEGINVSDAEAEETAEDDLSLHDVADVASEMESSPDRSAPEENASGEGLRSILSCMCEYPDLTISLSAH
jgi:hypothetical protein